MIGYQLTLVGIPHLAGDIKTGFARTLKVLESP